MGGWTKEVERKMARLWMFFHIRQQGNCQVSELLLLNTHVGATRGMRRVTIWWVCNIYVGALVDDGSPESRRERRVRAYESNLDLKIRISLICLVHTIWHIKFIRRDPRNVIKSRKAIANDTLVVKSSSKYHILFFYKVLTQRHDKREDSCQPFLR